MSLKLLAVAGWALWCVDPALAASEPLIRIEFKVLDRTGARFSEAKLDLEGDRGARYSATKAETGLFHADVPGGDYRVLVTGPDFLPFRRCPIQVSQARRDQIALFPVPRAGIVMELSGDRRLNDFDLRYEQIAGYQPCLMIQYTLKTCETAACEYGGPHLLVTMGNTSITGTSAVLDRSRGTLTISSAQVWTGGSLEAGSKAVITLKTGDLRVSGDPRR